MSHYALVKNNLVVDIIQASQDFIDCQACDADTVWVLTSVNTQNGINQEGGAPVRKNFAGIGFTYNAEQDEFVPPQPWPSWHQDSTTGQWQPPTPAPVDNYLYIWNEHTQGWDQLYDRTGGQND